MLLILKDAIDDLGRYVDNGSCERTKIVARINEATRRLLERPNTPVNVVRWMRYCTKNNTITLPREAEKILYSDLNGIPKPIFDVPYEFLTDGPGAMDPWDCRQYLMDMGDGFPTFFDIPSLVTPDEGVDECDDFTHDPMKIIAVSTSASDRNREIRLLGKDDMSADILTTGVPGEVLRIGVWENGVEGTLNTNDLPPRTTQEFMDITGVIKPVTVGYVSLYTYDEDTHRMYFLAKYHPDETRPGYRRYKVLNPNFEEGTCIKVLVRLRYVPAKHDNDVLIIQNLGALKLMLMAISRENEREFEEAQAYEAKAYTIIRDQYSNSKTIYPSIQVTGPWGFRGINMR